MTSHSKTNFFSKEFPKPKQQRIIKNPKMQTFKNIRLIKSKQKNDFGYNL